MTTAALAPPLAGFHLLLFHQLRPSPSNPRRHMSDEQDGQLADSIRSVGILEPLIVRPRADGATFEVVAGHRRLRAGHLAGVTEFPCLVRALSDTEALEIAVVENDQRRDVHPLDEAEAFVTLMEKGAYTPAALAAKLGRPERYILDRVRLLALAPEARDAFEADRLTLGHALLLARLTPAQQAQALPECFERVFDYEREDDDAKEVTVPVRDLRDWINRNIRLDVQAPEVQAEFPELADLAQRGDRVVMLSEVIWKAPPHEPDSPLGTAQWRQVEPGTPGAVQGVVVQGRRRGRLIWVEVAAPAARADRYPDDEGDGEDATRPAPRPAARETPAQRRQREAEEARARDERELLGRVIRRGLVQLAEGSGKRHLDAPQLRVIAAALAAAGDMFYPFRDVRDQVVAALGVPVEALHSYGGGDEARLLLGVEPLIRLICVMAVGAQSETDDYRQALEAFGVDVGAIEAEERAAVLAAAAPAPKRGRRRA